MADLRPFARYEDSIMDARDSIPLSEIKGWTEALVQKLADRWITTAEQVVGMATTDQGVTSLATELGVTPRKVQQLVKNAKAALPTARANALSEAVDTSHYGKGALPPEARR